MKIGKCLKCDAVGEVTEDHVIPDWFMKVMANFGVKTPEKQLQIICKKCNLLKAGKVDYKDETTRKMAQELIIKLQTNLS